MVVRPAVDTDSTVLERHVRDLSTDHAQFMAICDRESAIVLIGGCDELQLEKNLILLRRKILCEVHVGPPQVGYRETIRTAAEVDYNHNIRTGGADQFARVKFLIEPLEAGFGFEFENKAVGGAIPKTYISGIERGVQGVLDAGVVAGYPMIDLKVNLVDGAYRDEDSSVMAFEFASRAAFSEAARKATPVLLQPIVKVEVVTPEDCMGDVIGDLNSRQGLILGMDTRDNVTTFHACVPAAQMFGFSNVVVRLTQDRASFSVHFSHYEKVRSISNDDPPPSEPATTALRA